MEDGKKFSHNRLTLTPSMTIGVVLSTTVPAIVGCGEGCGVSVSIIASWKKEKKEEGSGVWSGPEEVSEIGVATLSFQLMCSGELNINDSCYSLWDGKFAT